MKSLSNALTAAAPEWAKLRADVSEGRVRAGVDLTPELVEAVQRTADLRRRGQKLDTFLAQQDAFERVSSPVEAWMRMFYDAKGRRAAGAPVVTERLKAYAIEARKVSAEHGLDLGLAPASADQIQAGAARKGIRDGGEGQADLGFRGATGNPPGEAVQLRRGAGDGTGDAGGQGRPGPEEGGSGSGGEGVVSDAGGPGRVAGPELELRSLQQQAQDLADALDVPLRQGRVQGGKDALGQFRNSDEVMRVRNVADFETVAHEAGHALEKRVGEPLSDLIDRYPAELGPLDYDPQRGDAGEGFAEWVRTAMFNPAAGQRQAPAFAQAFRALMQREAPDLRAAWPHCIPERADAERAVEGFVHQTEDTALAIITEYRAQPTPPAAPQRPKPETPL